MAAWLACTVTTLALIARPATARVDPDEVYWIGGAYYYHLAFERGDWTNPDWKLLPALENPPVSRYLIGLGLALNGRHVTTVDGLGSFYAYYKWNDSLLVQEPARMQQQIVVMERTDPRILRTIAEVHELHIHPADLFAARWVMVICGAITSLLLFLMGSAIANRPTGLLASQLVLVHPNVKDAYEHAMSDAAAYMCGTAAALAVWVLFRRFYLDERPPNLREGLRYALLAGATIGIAAATKMNWLTVGFLLAAIMLFLLVRAWRRADRAGAMVVLASGAAGMAMALLVYMLVNPTILLDPIDGLVAAIREPSLTTDVQRRLGIPAVIGVGEKVLALATLITGTVPTFILGLAGIALACRQAPRAGVWFVVAWFAIAFVVVTAWIPFKWSRYSLPAVMPFSLLLAYTLTTGAAALLALRRARSARRT